MQFDDSQTAAVDKSLKENDSIITGGAGTGKTTIMKELVERMDGKAELLTPTGKAAARLREITGLPASTIHRWLMWDGTQARRSRQAEYPLIIDEASMLDSWILSTLLRFNPPKIVLVGDVSQLQPVGKGSPFHDLVKHRPDIVSTLTHCYRSQAAVHIAATSIRQGNCPEYKLSSGGEVFSVIKTPGPESTQEKILSWVKNGEYDPEQDIILSCRNGDNVDQAGTVMALNKKIVDIVNPREADETWKVDDRIMNLKNNAELDWYNGDMGKITAIDWNGDLWVQPDRERDDPIRLTTQLKSNIIHAYALTVHKSQGSQYRRVFFVILQAHQRMMSRNLIYTGVTRAQKACIIVGQPNALRQGIQSLDMKKTVIQFLSKKAVEHENIQLRSNQKGSQL